MQAVALSVLLLLLFVPILVIIWQNQNKQAVYFKSPKVILIGGVCLMLDCLLNVLINTENTLSSKMVCIFSVYITLIPYMVAYFCLIFRAQRIFKVMRLTSKHLNRIYGLAKENHSTVGTLDASRSTETIN